MDVVNFYDRDELFLFCLFFDNCFKQIRMRVKAYGMVVVKRPRYVVFPGHKFSGFLNNV